MLVTCVLVAIKNVYPSGADLTTASAPILPPAPGRLSMTTVWPSSGRRLSAITRAVTSVLPPGGYGTTSLIGLEGQVSANAGNAACSKSKAQPIALITLFNIMISFEIVISPNNSINHLNTGARCINQSAWIPDVLITLAHLSISSLRNLPNCSGPAGSTTAPRFESFSFTPSSSSAVSTSLLNLATMSFGVLTGATSPHHTEASYPGTPASVKVGTSGNMAMRLGFATASARKRPDLMLATTSIGLMIMNDRRPPIRSVSAGEPPLYGTWTTSILVVSLNSSEAR